MPYNSNHDLPIAVRSHLPQAAQDIYRETFNSAWRTYANNPAREGISHAVAWAAVKRQYKKADGEWIQRE